MLPAMPLTEMATADPALLSAGADADAAERFAVEGLASLRLRADDGQLDAEAALAMLGAEPAQAAAAFAALWSADRQASAEPAGLYGLAARADTEGRTADALTVLAVLAGTAGAEQGGLLGLAVIAARQGRMAEAFDIASACLDVEDRHPRACSIAGICELERGNKAAAQSYLAAASRIARRRPEYARELQIAQRALLLMHLG